MRYSHGFFSYVNTLFGRYTTKLLKSWIKLRRDLIKIRIRIIFLKFCIDYNITPPHAYNISKAHVFLFDHRSKHRFNYVKRSFITKLIRIELKDAYRMFYAQKTESFRLMSNITKHLPFFVYHKFFQSQETSLFLLFQHEMDRLRDKMHWLLYKHNINKNKDIQNINYWASTVTSKNLKVPKNSPTFSFSKAKLPQNSQPLEIKISPEFLDHKHNSSLTTIRNKWFVNLSNTNIPHDVQCLLQLGENFSMPTNRKENVVIEFIKSIECNTNKFNIDTQLNIRNRAIPLISSLPYLLSNNQLNPRISSLDRTVRTFIKKNPDVIFTRADKGNITVALNREDYINNITNMLEDVNTYTKIKKDPINNMTCNLRKLLIRWKTSNFITNSTYRSLICSDGCLPRAYGPPSYKK